MIFVSESASNYLCDKEGLKASKDSRKAGGESVYFLKEIQPQKMPSPKSHILNNNGTCGIVHFGSRGPKIIYIHKGRQNLCKMEKLY